MTREDKAARRRSSRRIERRREVSAGGIVWRRLAEDGFEIAMIQPAGRRVWALPKGNVEAGESAAETAQREVREETGLITDSAEPLGELSYVYSLRERGKLVRIFKTVNFFLMRHAGGDTSLHDEEIERVEWMEIGDAIARSSYQSEREMIRRAGDRLRSGG
jgi:ADP-ribose pyrophosphatase YjhB (NUDIX family)